VIGHVVAVGAAGPALEAGREIGLAHPERVEIWCESSHIFEAERGTQLESVARAPRPDERRHRLLEERVEIRPARHRRHGATRPCPGLTSA
jgi:hypothetical protein